jgi:ligand-binding sensor domain-containing protein
MRTGLAIATVLGLARAAHADVRAVETSTSEARACLPLPGGDALVGTGGGLVRVDEKGAPRGVWTASDGLPGTRVDGVIADGAKAWIATDGGVAEIAAGDDGGVTIARAIATKPARDVARFEGAVYVATWDGGVVKLGKGTSATQLAMKGGAKAARNRVAALAVADGALWAGTEAGLYRLRGARLEKVTSTGVTALAGDGARLWIGTSGGLVLRDEHGDARAIGGGEVRRLAIDPGGALVIAGADGLATVDRGRVVALRHAPATGVAEAIGVGADGARCAGGLGGLWLDSAPDAPWLHAAAAAGPPSNDISALATDGDRLYVGTFDQGLAIREHGAWRAVDDPALDRRINAILVEPRAGASARVWIGTAEGVVVLDGGQARRIGKRDGLPGRNVLALARLADGRIVAGTSQGAAFVDGAAPERVGPRSIDAAGGGAPGPGRDVGNVWAIAEAPAGTLWLGTTTGLYRGAEAAWTSKDDADDPDAASTAWTRFSVASGALADDWVTALSVRGGDVYAGTYHGGVAKLDASTGAAAQLGGGWINPAGLAWDGDRLTASTMDGLETLAGATWSTIAGLPGKDTTAMLVGGDGTRWVATRRGLAALR